jgi:hypothetical protein
MQGIQMDPTSIQVVQAASFVTVSTLVSIALIVIVTAILVINNLFNRFWKPVKIFNYVNMPVDQHPITPIQE